MTSRPSLGRQLGAELVGSLLLATIVVGSGIAAQQFFGDHGRAGSHASLNQSVMAKSVKSNRSGLPFVSTISTP